MFKTFRLMEREEALQIAACLPASAWSEGRARTERATGTIKRNEEIIPRGEDDPLFPLAKRVKEAFMGHGGVMAHTLAYRLTIPKFNRYQGGGTYRRHYDASPMTQPGMRTDFSCTLSLTDPADYDGGVLTVESPEGHQVQATRGEAGTCVIYNCEHAHWVTPVSRGARVSSVFWIRSLIADPQKRATFTKFTDILSRCENSGEAIQPYGDDYTSLTGIQTQLARMWIDA